VHPDANGFQFSFDCSSRFQYEFFVLVLAVNRYESHLDGREFRRQDQALVIGVRHDERTDQACGDAPGGRPDVFQLVILVLELAIKCLGEILTQKVGRACLQGLTVLHERFDAVGLYGTGKSFGRRLDTLDYRHGHVVLGKRRVDVQDGQRFVDGFLLRGVGRVAFLPQELHGAQEQTRAHFPSHDIGPLVQQDRKVAPGLDPLAVGVPDDGLGRRAHDQILLQFRIGIGNQSFFIIHFQTRVGDDRAFLGEAFHVIRFTRQERLRDEDGEVGVRVTGVLEHAVQTRLHVLPKGVPIRADDHATANRGIVSQLGRLDDVQVPLGIIGFSGSDGLSHGRNGECE